MDTEILDPVLLQDPECVKELGSRHAVLRIARRIHDPVADLEDPAGIIAAAHRLREFADCFRVALDHREIVKVHDRADLIRVDVFFIRRVIGGEHDVFSVTADRLRHHKLCHGRAVAAASLLKEQGENDRIGLRLNGKILAESGIPGKGLMDLANILAKSLLIIDIEWSGDLCSDLL